MAARRESCSLGAAGEVVSRGAGGVGEAGAGLESKGAAAGADNAVARSALFGFRAGGTGAGSGGTGSERSGGRGASATGVDGVVLGVSEGEGALGMEVVEDASGFGAEPPPDVVSGCRAGFAKEARIDPHAAFADAGMA